MKINNQIGIIFFSVILLFSINSIMLVSIIKGNAGVQHTEKGKVLKDDGTETIVLTSPRPMLETIAKKFREGEEFDPENYIVDDTDTVVIGSAVVDEDGKIIQYSIDTDNPERKRVFIAHIFFKPDWRYIPILIGFLRDPESDVAHKADNALVAYTVMYYDYGENSPHIMRDKNQIISETRIKKWEEWYRKNQDAVPETIPLEDRAEKYAKIAPTEEEIKQSEDKLLKGAKEELNDPEAGLITRAVSSKILREAGDYDGFQAILPELRKFRDLIIEDLPFKEQEKESEKIVQSYKNDKVRKVAKEQLIQLIESRRESINLRGTAIIMAFAMKNVFTSSEVQSLIENVPEIDLKLQLIQLLGDMGNINDVPFFLDLTKLNDKKIKVEVLNTLSHMSLNNNWANKKEAYVEALSSENDSAKRINYILGRWTSWWEQQQKKYK